jgi:hypothetical protein
LPILEEEVLKAKRDLYIEEKKAQILSSAIRGQKVPKDTDPIISSAEKAQESIDKGFSAIDKLLLSIEILLSLLPVSAKPEQSYFLFTLKNPKPLQNIDKGVPEVNEELLEKLQKPFDLNRDDLLNAGLKSKFTTSYLNGKAVAKAITASMPAIIPYDPYPPYEKLRATNIAWTLGYLPSWGKTGNAQYGFPGFPKLPVG